LGGEKEAENEGAVREMGGKERGEMEARERLRM